MSKRTEIATLGEFGLIRHLTEKIELKNESTVKSKYSFSLNTVVFCLQK